MHGDAEFAVSFIRTLRIPDDGRDHPLPPGLGTFARRHVDDHAPRLPGYMTGRGGVILPMRSAMSLPSLSHPRGRRRVIANPN
ncbi:MAG: hypothetical protein ACREEU_02460 [Acetobacteraceae bacterium]